MPLKLLQFVLSHFLEMGIMFDTFHFSSIYSLIQIELRC